MENKKIIDRVNKVHGTKLKLTSDIDVLMNYVASMTYNEGYIDGKEFAIEILTESVEEIRRD